MNKVLIVIMLLLFFVLIYSRQQRRNAPRIIYKKKLINGYNAMTVPPIGIYMEEKHKDNAALLEHELYHWKQYQDLGLISFYAQYFYENYKNGYDLNALEIAARGYESEYCKTNYTECVRTGLANTIYSPCFRT